MLLLCLSVVLSLLTSFWAQADHTHQKGNLPKNALGTRQDEPTELYSILPKDVTVKSQADAINKLLDEYVSDKTEIYASEVNDDNMWTLFWSAPLTESQADTLKKDPNVGAIEKASTDHGDPLLNYADGTTHMLHKRDDGLARQRNAAEEMKFLSQPLDLKLASFRDYVYDASAGRDVTVYISDTGANLTHHEFTDGSGVKNRVRWLFGQYTSPPDTAEIDSSVLGHGTCVLDKVAGHKYGVAKNVNPVIVRAVRSQPLAFLDTVRQIRADYVPIYNRDPNTARAIINMSWGYPASELGVLKDAWIGELRILLKALVSRGATIVVPAGNAPGNPPINQWPALFAGESGNDGIPQLIIVGGIHVYDGRNGELWERSMTAPFVSVYAPSFKINCANGKGGYRIREEVTGTSFAAAQVSGMAAYFLGLSSLRDYLHDDDGETRVQKLKEHIISASWDRAVDAGPLKAIYNNEDPRTCRAIPQTDDDEVGEPCQVSSTTTGNDMTVMGDCYITTVTPTGDATPTPVPQCSCAGGMAAGVGSTEVMGTTYTWCQTAGPPVYPTGMQTVVSPVPTVAQPAPAEPTTEDAPAPDPEADTDTPEKPEGKCDKEDASPLSVGEDC
ncbi:MAG: hypothetical protein Q9172_002727 [Xanthocarpia lactea]